VDQAQLDKLFGGGDGPRNRFGSSTSGESSGSALVRPSAIQPINTSTGAVGPPPSQARLPCGTSPVAQAKKPRRLQSPSMPSGSPPAAFRRRCLSEARLLPFAIDAFRKPACCKVPQSHMDSCYKPQRLTPSVTVPAEFGQRVAR